MSTALATSAPIVGRDFLSGMKDFLAELLHRRLAVKALAPLRERLQALAASAWATVEHDAAEFDDVEGAVYGVAAAWDTWRLAEEASTALARLVRSPRAGTLPPLQPKHPNRGDQVVWASIAARTACIVDICHRALPPTPKRAPSAAKRLAQLELVYRQTLSLGAHPLERDALLGLHRAFVSTLLLTTGTGHADANWRAVARCWDDGLLKALVCFDALGYQVPLAVLPMSERTSWERHAGGVAALETQITRASEESRQTGLPASLFPAPSAPGSDQAPWP